VLPEATLTVIDAELLALFRTTVSEGTLAMFVIVVLPFNANAGGCV